MREPNEIDELFTVQPSGEEFLTDADIMSLAGAGEQAILVPLKLANNMMFLKELVLPYNSSADVNVTIGIYILVDPIPREPDVTSLHFELLPFTTKTLYAPNPGGIYGDFLRYVYDNPIKLNNRNKYFLGITGAITFTVSTYSLNTAPLKPQSNVIKSYSTRPLPVNGVLPNRLRSNSYVGTPLAILRSELGRVLYDNHR